MGFVLVGFFSTFAEIFQNMPMLIAVFQSTALGLVPAQLLLFSANAGCPIGRSYGFLEHRWEE